MGSFLSPKESYDWIEWLFFYTLLNICKIWAKNEKTKVRFLIWVIEILLFAQRLKLLKDPCWCQWESWVFWNEKCDFDCGIWKLWAKHGPIIEGWVQDIVVFLNWNFNNFFQNTGWCVCWSNSSQVACLFPYLVSL